MRNGGANPFGICINKETGGLSNAEIRQDFNHNSSFLIVKPCRSATGWHYSSAVVSNENTVVKSYFSPA